MSDKEIDKREKRIKMNRVAYVGFILAIVVSTVMTSCTTSFTHPGTYKDGDGSKLPCRYWFNETSHIRIDSGGKYTHGYPVCEECECNDKILRCCRYGISLGKYMGLPNDCKHKENTCELLAVSKEDESKPCPGWYWK